MREMRIRGRGKTKQKGINPLHDPGRDNVKQGKTNEDKKEGKRQLRKKGRWERGTSEFVMAVATATVTRRGCKGRCTQSGALMRSR